MTNPNNESRKRVLILCTGNSSRSQMAEGLVNHFLGQQWKAFSAGTQPTGLVHPLAVRALAEIGIDHHGESKPIDRFYGQSFDVVITVCDDAAENCPVWLGRGKRVHIGFEDPGNTPGGEAEKLEAFRQVRDDMRVRIVDYLRELGE